MIEKMKIYFVRHGKDDEKYRDGWSDRPMTLEGEKDVRVLADKIYVQKNKFNIQKIISSDLKRTKDTANIINKKLQTQIEFTARLREMNNGKLAGMLNEEAQKTYPGIYYNTLEMNERYPGGESPLEFYNRIVKDFEKIIKENVEYENIMVVTHSGVINAIYRYINNLEWSNKIKPIKVSNNSIYSLVIEKDKRYFELENYILN